MNTGSTLKTMLVAMLCAALIVALSACGGGGDGPECYDAPPPAPGTKQRPDDPCRREAV